MKQQPSQTTVSPEPNVPRGFQRCHARNRDRSQCRLHAQDTATGLCSRHAARAGESLDALQDFTDLSKEILVVNDGDYGTVEHINSILSNVVELIAQGRITPRRAAVITYALSLMLRSVIAMDRKIANSPPQIIFDAPRPDRSDDKPAAPAHDNAKANANTQAPGSFDESEKYSRLRT